MQKIAIYLAATSLVSMLNWGTRIAFAQPLEEIVSSSVTDYVKEIRQSGLVAGVISGDEQYARGFQSAASPSLDGETIFEVGELTQVFTAALLYHYELQGQLSIDDPLDMYVPVTVDVPQYQAAICTTEARQLVKKDDDAVYYYHSYCVPHPDSPRVFISLCNLTTHTSGLPDLPPDLKIRGKESRQNPFRDYSADEVINALNACSLERAPGEKVGSSRWGSAVLGQVLQRNFEGSFEDQLEKELLKPMKMDGAVFSSNPKNPAAVATGTNKKGKPVPAWESDGFTPSIGMKASANDLLEFLKANIGLSYPYHHQLLLATHEPRMKIADPEIEGTSMGLGWLVTPFGKNGQHIVWMKGATGGFESFIGFHRESQTGVVLLANSKRGKDELTRMGMEMIRRLAGRRAPAEGGGKP